MRRQPESGGRRDSSSAAAAAGRQSAQRRQPGRSAAAAFTDDEAGDAGAEEFPEPAGPMFTPTRAGRSRRGRAACSPAAYHPSGAQGSPPAAGAVASVAECPELRVLTREIGRAPCWVKLASHGIENDWSHIVYSIHMLQEHIHGVSAASGPYSPRIIVMLTPRQTQPCQSQALASSLAA